MILLASSCNAGFSPRSGVLPKLTAVGVLFVSLLLSSSVWAQKPEPGPTRAVQDSSQHYASVIVESEVPVLVDFWAPWCTPCHMLNPTIKKIEKHYGSRIKIVKINTDIHQQIAQYFSVMSIPVIFLVKDKSVHTSIPGVQPESVYMQAIDALLVENDTTAGE